MRVLLPSSDSGVLLRQDRFDLLSSEDPELPFWDLLRAILKPQVASVSALIDQLKTISITLRGEVPTDYDHLKTFFESYWPSKGRFLSRVWPTIISLALEMPVLFPEGSLPCLVIDNPRIVLSRRQVACLLVHQFLCSIPAQPWMTDSSVDFHIWFKGNCPSSLTTQAYLYALFTYFERLAYSPGEGSPSPVLACPIEKWPITFTLRSLHGDEAKLAKLHGNKFAPLRVVRLEEPSTEPVFLGLPSGACVISANKNVGFGSTGTQEETHVGSSPEACVAVLMTPTLRETEVLVVQGAEAMITMDGYGRRARLGRVLEPAHDCSNLWPGRTMLFMDALELDMYESSGEAELVPDFLPGNVDREITKAYTAFSSGGSGNGKYDEIYTGLWGCGAFGGNWQAKTIIQWCAASMAGVPLRFVVAGKLQGEFAARLEVFTRAILDHGWSVGTVLKFLTDLEPSSDVARDTFSHLENAVKSAK